MRLVATNVARSVIFVLLCVCVVSVPLRSHSSRHSAVRYIDACVLVMPVSRASTTTRRPGQTRLGAGNRRSDRVRVATTGECGLTLRARRRCGLMSNYSDRFFRYHPVALSDPSLPVLLVMKSRSPPPLLTVTPRTPDAAGVYRLISTCERLGTHRGL